MTPHLTPKQERTLALLREHGPATLTQLARPATAADLGCHPSRIRDSLRQKLRRLRGKKQVQVNGQRWDISGRQRPPQSTNWASEQQQWLSAVLINQSYRQQIGKWQAGE